MKAQIEPGCTNGNGIRAGKVQKRKSKLQKQKVKVEEVEPEESAEVKEYLDKLQEIVPFMPKDQRLSKFEVITNAIDYIRDLQHTLGLPQCEDEDFDLEFDLPLAESFGSEDEEVYTDLIDISASSMSPNSDSTSLSLAVSTSVPSPNENYMAEDYPEHNNNNNSIRQPFCAISNRNSDSNASLEESLKLKQISCRL